VSGRISAISDETAADLERWRAAASQSRLDISDVPAATPCADLRTQQLSTAGAHGDAQFLPNFERARRDGQSEATLADPQCRIAGKS